jgi:hypothetical protein
MKLVAKTKRDISMKEDPRLIREVARWQTLAIMIDEEWIDRSWRVPLYRLYRTGWITSTQREAGDEYQRIVYDHRECQGLDPDIFDDEFTLRRIERAKAKWNEAVKVLGLGRKVVDELVLLEKPVLTEREKYIARDGLQLLANFFGFERNKR